MATDRMTGITNMAAPEPSDASGYKPVNRIALLTEYGLFESAGIPPPEGGPVGAAGRVVNLDEPEGMTDLVPALARNTREEFDLPSMERASIYRRIYYAVLLELAEGRPRKKSGHSSWRVCHPQRETEPLSQPELSHRSGCRVEQV